MYIPQCAWYAPAKLVAAEIQHLQVGELPQFNGDLPSQVVVGKSQLLQAGQLAQFRRDLLAQVVLSEVQVLQEEELAQFSRYLSSQPVLKKLKGSYAPVGIRFNAVPFSKSLATQPIVVVRPVGSIRGVLEGNQGFPVRFGGVRGFSARFGGRRVRPPELTEVDATP